MTHINAAPSPGDADPRRLGRIVALVIGVVFLLLFLGLAGLALASLGDDAPDDHPETTVPE
jgi:hypothetical protein